MRDKQKEVEDKYFRNFLLRCKNLKEGKSLQYYAGYYSLSYSYEVQRTDRGWVLLTLRLNKIDQQLPFSNRKELKEVLAHVEGVSISTLQGFARGTEKKYHHLSGRMLNQSTELGGTK
jgi:hypothetical protein